MKVAGTPRYWFSEDTQAFHAWQEAKTQILAKSPMEAFSLEAQIRSSSVEGERKPTFGDGTQDYMMQRYKNLALIQISGNLVKSDSFWNRYYGQVSYDEIRRSVIMALSDRSVDGILAIMGTPGGTASGADAMASFFTKADQTKPFYAFAESDMCSGGYYLGAPAREIYAQRAALVGSIGVIMVHMDVLGAMQEQGITPTVFRAGEFKALGTPYEHLDKKSSASIQKTMDTYFAMFNQHVVDNRGFKDIPDLLAEAGEGRVFMAEEAKQVGLVDQVAELEDALEEISDKSKTQSGRSSQFSVTNVQQRGSSMNRKARMAAASGEALSPEQLAALAAGADPASLGISLEENPAGGDTDDEEGADKGGEGGEGGDKPSETEGGKKDDDGEGAETPNEPSQSAGAPAGVSLAEIMKLSQDLAEARVELKAAKKGEADALSQIEGLEATVKAQGAIVVQMIAHRQVALGFQPSDVASMTAEQHVELFGKLDSDFKERFKPGQVSRPSQEAVKVPSLGVVAGAAREMTGKL